MNPTGSSNPPSNLPDRSYMKRFEIDKALKGIGREGRSVKNVEKDMLGSKYGSFITEREMYKAEKDLHKRYLNEGDPIKKEVIAHERDVLKKLRGRLNH